jgi:hypothetical protein
MLTITRNEHWQRRGLCRPDTPPTAGMLSAGPSVFARAMRRMNACPGCGFSTSTHPHDSRTVESAHPHRPDCRKGERQRRGIEFVPMSVASGSSAGTRGHRPKGRCTSHTGTSRPIDRNGQLSVQPARSGERCLPARSRRKARSARRSVALHCRDSAPRRGMHSGDVPGLRCDMPPDPWHRVSPVRQESSCRRWKSGSSTPAPTRI